MCDAGKRRYDRKQAGFGGQTKPVFHKKVRIRDARAACQQLQAPHDRFTLVSHLGQCFPGHQAPVGCSLRVPAVAAAVVATALLRSYAGILAQADSGTVDI
jgi:hypothetical protein